MVESSVQAGVAQLVEQLIRNQQVAGSSPIAGSNLDLGTSSPDPLHRHSRGPFDPRSVPVAHSLRSFACELGPSSPDPLHRHSRGPFNPRSVPVAHSLRSSRVSWAVVPRPLTPSLAGAPSIPAPFRWLTHCAPSRVSWGRRPQTPYTVTRGAPASAFARRLFQRALRRDLAVACPQKTSAQAKAGHSVPLAHFASLVRDSATISARATARPRRSLSPEDVGTTEGGPLACGRSGDLVRVNPDSKRRYEIGRSRMTIRRIRGSDPAPIDLAQADINPDG